MISIKIVDGSEVAEARRRAAQMGELAGFSQADAGRVALVATELATNIIKHGGGGEMLIGSYEEPGGSGIELIALDRGRGIADLQASLADGYSSAGTAGNGLGAVFRQAHSVEIASWPGIGTAVLARFEQGTPPQQKKPRSSTWGAIAVPKPGEEVCGDSWSISDNASARTLIVADGLGHGPDASDAAVQAIRVFHRHKDHQVSTLLDYIHGGLRATRGAAVSIARIDRVNEKISFAGLGNVAGLIVAADGTSKNMVSLAGTAGHNARKINAFDYPYKSGLVILHSDGLSSSWSLNRYAGIARMHPTLIAAVLYRDHARRNDDATVLVSSGAAPS
jgi:anti-sigma regulatory factor (Ser/Thr protein kinase)